jgi:hypothetical protein
MDEQDGVHKPERFELHSLEELLAIHRGGQARLNPSSGNFFVASMPSLLPLAMSHVAWSSTLAGLW